MLNGRDFVIENKEDQEEEEEEENTNLPFLKRFFFRLRIFARASRASDKLCEARLIS